MRNTKCFGSYFSSIIHNADFNVFKLRECLDFRPPEGLMDLYKSNEIFHSFRLCLFVFEMLLARFT